MTSIDPTGRLLAYLRQQTQEWRRQRPGEAGAPAQQSPITKQDSLGRTAQELRAIDKDDPQSRRKAFKIFLRSVLSRELGAGVANDPGFPSLVERVYDTMEADPELKLAIDEAGELLLKAGSVAGK